MKITAPILAISTQLAALAKPQPNAELLLLIINQLFLDLDAGHSCSYCQHLAQQLDLKAAQIIKLLRASELAAVYRQIPAQLEAKPISIIASAKDNLIYITKYLAYELSIAQQVKLLTLSYSQQHHPQYQSALSSLQNLSRRRGLPNEEQLAAIAAAAQQKISIISGGPGTGKTTTVVLLLWLFYQLYGSELKVKICAPTGKAALRVRDSIEHSINDFQLNPADGIDCTLLQQQLLAEAGNFGTIHKLLGYQQDSIYFKYNQAHPLMVEVLIVDESSMVSLPLFSKLLQAVTPDTIKHIIFLGDKNQLSSVEEGFVFASMINRSLAVEKYDLFSAAAAPNLVSELISSKRNQGAISDLASAILQQNSARIQQLLTTSASIKLVAPTIANLLGHLFNSESSPLLQYLDYSQRLNLSESLNIGGRLNPSDNLEINESVTLDEGLSGDLASSYVPLKIAVQNLFKQFSQQSLLCLTNRGILGSENLNLQIERKIRQHYGLTSSWYSGRPIIILQNDYALGLFNGDIGICVCSATKVSILFENGREFIPEVLPAYQLAYAITIHKSQGSEYEQVNIVLAASTDAAGAAQSLLSRELVYTAVTRARSSVCIFSTTAVLINAIGRVTLRNSGLGEFLD